MPLPWTTSSLLAYFNPANALFDSNLNVISVPNSNLTKPFTQLAANRRPTWSSTALGNKYPGIIFTGNLNVTNINQKLSVAIDPIIVSNKPLIITIASQHPTYIDYTVATGAQDNGVMMEIGNSSVLSPAFGGSTKGFGFLHGFQAGSGALNILTPYLIPDNGTYTFPSAGGGSPAQINSPGLVSDQNIHVYTQIFDSTTFTIRADGVTIATYTNPSMTGNYTFDTISFGNSCYESGTPFPNPFPYSNFRGALGKCLAYTGQNIDLGPEEYLLNYYGINHTPLVL